MRVLRWLDAYSRLVGGPFVARVALLACIGGLAFVVCAFGGILLWLLPAYVLKRIASLCTTHCKVPVLTRRGPWSRGATPRQSEIQTHTGEHVFRVLPLKRSQQLLQIAPAHTEPAAPQ